MDQRRMKAALTAAAALAFVGFSAAAPPFMGYTAEQLPQTLGRPPVQPAGYAFAIWGVIYGWLVVGTLYGLIKRAADPRWDAMRWPLSVALILGAGWLYVAVADAIAATVMIFAMLAGAVTALARAPRGGGVNLWLGRVPVGLFAGWLTAASFVSLGAVLGGLGLVPSGKIAAFAMIPMAGLVAAWVLTRLKGGGAYAFAAGWGLVGIVVANLTTHADVAALAGVAAVGVALLWWPGYTSA